MFLSILPLFLAQTAPVIIPVPSRIARPMAAAISLPAETFSVRIVAAGNLLWQGRLRISQNSGADYNQTLSQAAAMGCSPASSYDRSERQNISFSLQPQDNSQTGRSYRVSASWQRPVPNGNCGEAEARTVQVTRTVVLDANGKEVIEADAGLRIEISRD